MEPNKQELCLKVEFLYSYSFQHGTCKSVLHTGLRNSKAAEFLIRGVIEDFVVVVLLFYVQS